MRSWPWVHLAAGLFLLTLSGCRKTEANPEAAAGNPTPSTDVAATSSGRGAEGSDPASGRSVETGAPVDVQVPGVFELSGTAQPARTSRLSAKGSGILKAIFAREGDRVATGQVLCALDATDISLRAEAAQISDEQAAEAVVNAKRDLDRITKLSKAGAMTDTSLEKAQLGLRMAELGKKGAEVGLKMANQALYDTRLRAPFNGVITKLMAEEGQYITSMPPTVIFVVVDTDTLEVRVAIPERKLPQVKPGVPAVVTLPSLNAERKAQVDRIADVVDPMTRAAEAIIRLDNHEHSLAAGTYVRVRFPTIADDSASANQTPPALPPAPVTPGAESGGR